jgi:RNA recognition motif-containing protein
MKKSLFVGNLPYSAEDSDLEEAFSVHGKVVSAVVVRDPETGRSRGFGVVEMETEDAAADAVRALDGFEMGGRRLRVNEAQSKKEYQRRSDIGEIW